MLTRRIEAVAGDLAGSVYLRLKIFFNNRKCVSAIRTR
jgi:hypothetical protein